MVLLLLKMTKLLMVKMWTSPPANRIEKHFGRATVIKSHYKLCISSLLRLRATDCMREKNLKNLALILGPVVQSIVSLTSSLRGQLVKNFLLKNEKSFCNAKASHIFQQKILAN